MDIIVLVITIIAALFSPKVAPVKPSEPVEQSAPATAPEVNEAPVAVPVEENGNEN